MDSLSGQVSRSTRSNIEFEINVQTILFVGLTPGNLTANWVSLRFILFETQKVVEKSPFDQKKSN